MSDLPLSVRSPPSRRRQPRAIVSVGQLRAATNSGTLNEVAQIGRGRQRLPPAIIVARAARAGVRKFASLQEASCLGTPLAGPTGWAF